MRPGGALAEIVHCSARYDKAFWLDAASLRCVAYLGQHAEHVGRDARVYLPSRVFQSWSARNPLGRITVHSRAQRPGT